MLRKQYPIELKLKIVQECLETGNCAVVARRYGIASNIVNRWTRNYRKYGEAAFKGGSTKTSTNVSFHTGEYKKVLSENEKLKKLLGEKELEIEILKDLLKKNKPTLADKVAIARKWIALGYKVVVVLQILGVSRSTYYYHLWNRNRIGRGGGRPIAGYSFNSKGQRIDDDQIKESLLQLIQGERSLRLP